MKSAESANMTFSNMVRVGGQKTCLDDLSKEAQESIANSLIYRPLTTIPNVEIVQTA